jgi:Bor protein
MFRGTLSRIARYLLLLGLTSGCYHQYVAVAKPDPEPRAQSKTVTSYLWGLVHAKDTVQVCPRTNGMDQVEVKANVGQSLLSFITLGIVVPRTVVWHCSRPQERPSDIGLVSPASAR